MLKIRPTQAKEFYRDLCRKYNGDADKTCQGTASVEHIAETMEMEIEDVAMYCFAMVYYGITEKQGDKYVI